MYYVPRFVFVEHSVCHEPISVLINVFTLLAWCLLSTLWVLALTMCEPRSYPPCRHKAIVVMRRIGPLYCLHDSTIYIYIYIYIERERERDIDRYRYRYIDVDLQIYRYIDICIVKSFTAYSLAKYKIEKDCLIFSLDVANCFEFFFSCKVTLL